MSTIYATMERETEKALLVYQENRESVWIPKSACTSISKSGPDRRGHRSVTIKCEDWVPEKKNLRAT